VSIAAIESKPQWVHYSHKLRFNTAAASDPSFSKVRSDSSSTHTKYRSLFYLIKLIFMPTIYQLKPASQNLLRPIVPWLAKLGVTPNQVTIFTTCLAFGCGGLILWNNSFLFLVPFLMAIRATLNVIDGMLAREHQMKTTLGGILNELADVIFDAAIYLPFGLLPGVSGYLVAIVVVLSIISEMTGLLGLTVGSQRQYDGPMYKTDRGVMFSIIAVLFGLGIFPNPWLDLVWTGLIGLSILTIFNRINSTLIETKKDDLESAS
jgi:CDP-diacylglycerol---glycerol-3-phosphate 3-phosphatidyltransferase